MADGAGGDMTYLQYFFGAGAFLLGGLLSALGLRRKNTHDEARAESFEPVTKLDLLEMKNQIQDSFRTDLRRMAEEATNERRTMYKRMEDFSEAISTSHRELDKRIHGTEVELARQSGRPRKPHEN